MFYWVGSDSAPAEFEPEDKRWVEIWNDVFMQYNKTKEGKYEILKQQNVDTGMGVERTLAILENKSSVYETEPFVKIIKQIEIPRIGNEGLQEKLKNQIKYGNELSLRNRLQDIFEKYSDVLNKMIKDKNRLIGIVVDTRNYLTHFNKELEDRSAKGKELIGIVNNLKLIMEICLLYEIGFDTNTIIKLYFK
jgi:alanyl-tRNA synthetase